MEWNTDSALELSTIMERVTTILDEDDMCVLGTVEEQGPRLTPCFFAPLGDHRLVFVSSKGARHVANAQADPRCSALVVPRRPQGRPVSVHLSGPVTRPRGGSRLAALTAYAARMSGRLSSAANGVHDLLDKRVFVLEAERIELRVVGSTLVITSPGGLRGITEDALGRPDSKCAVNPVLYEICKNLHTTDGARLITDESGIREVRDAAARADLPDPILRDSGVRFTAILRWPATETAEKAAPEEKKAAPEAAEEEKEAAEEAPAPRRSPGTPPAGVPRRTAPPTPASGVQRRGRSKQPRPIFPGSPASTQRRPVSTSPRQASPKTLTDAQRRLLPDLPQPAPANVPADKRAADAAEPEGLAALSRNAPAVWAALSTSHSMSALKRATGLSVQQLRRALQHLIGAGFVEMVGGQGHKETTYRRRPVEGRTD